MKRALILSSLAIATLFISAPTADAGGFSISIGGGRSYCGYGHGGLFGHGFGHRSYYRGYYGGGYRGYSHVRPYYPWTYGYRSSIYYTAPFYRSYGYGGYGCASAFSYPGGVVAVPVAPLYADASRAYGPDSVKEFMGVDRDFAKGAIAAEPRIIDVRPAEPRIVGKADAEDRIASNAEARARAVRFVSFGDDKFGEQEYHSAAQRYRFAIEAAPDVAGAHFRQGFAYIASNRYDLAAKAFRRGLALDPTWVDSGFHLDELYEGNALAKGSHLDALAKSALIDRGNADHYFLLGVMLYFDGQTERATKFFQRAEALSSDDDDDHISVFLVPLMPRAEDAV